MLLTTTIILSLLAVVMACSDSAQGERTDVHSTRAAPSPPLTLPTRPLQWGDVNIIHTTDSHGWMLGHQKPSFPEPNYRCVESSGWNKIDSEELIPPSSGDLGDFASFVAHMKTIAIVHVFSPLVPCVELTAKLLFRSAMLIFCSLILEICTMVCMHVKLPMCCKVFIPVTYFVWTGTGLTDGFPPGGIDAHDVPLNFLNFWNILYIYSFRPINLLRNCPMI